MVIDLCYSQLLNNTEEEKFRWKLNGRNEGRMLVFPFGKWKAIHWSPIRRNYRGQQDKPWAPTFSIIRLIPVGCADGKARTLKRSESNYSIWVGVYRSAGDRTRDEDSPSWCALHSNGATHNDDRMNCNIRLDADPELYRARLRWYSCPYSAVITISKRLNGGRHRFNARDTDGDA